MRRRMKPVRAWAVLNDSDEVITPFECSQRGGRSLVAVFRDRGHAEQDCCPEGGDRLIRVEIHELTPKRPRRRSKK